MIFSSQIAPVNITRVQLNIYASAHSSFTDAEIFWKRTHETVYTSLGSVNTSCQLKGTIYVAETESIDIYMDNAAIDVTTNLTVDDTACSNTGSSAIVHTFSDFENGIVKNISFYANQICDPYGTFISNYCNGSFVVNVYADGACGTYEEITGLSC